MKEKLTFANHLNTETGTWFKQSNIDKKQLNNHLSNI